MHCSSLSFVGSQFIFLNSLALTCCLELSFKQKRIQLFWVTCNLFLIFWLIKGYQGILALSKCSWIKEFHNNLRNFGFRNSFCLCKDCNFVLIFLYNFIATDSSLKLASREQLRYSTIRYRFILLLLYVMLTSGKFLSLLKRMHFVLYSPKWIDTLIYSKHFRFP